jgi:hypothetical protein
MAENCVDRGQAIRDNARPFGAGGRFFASLASLRESAWALADVVRRGRETRAERGLRVGG